MLIFAIVNFQFVINKEKRQVEQKSKEIQKDYEEYSRASSPNTHVRNNVLWNVQIKFPTY